MLALHVWHLSFLPRLPNSLPSFPYPHSNVATCVARSHVFEAVDEDKDKEAEEKTLRDTVKLAEQLLESLKKKQ